MGAASFTSTLGSTTLPSDVIPAMVVETSTGNPTASVDLSLGGFRACGAIAPLLSLLAVIPVMEGVMDATVR